MPLAIGVFLSWKVHEIPLSRVSRTCYVDILVPLAKYALHGGQMQSEGSRC